MFESKVIFMKYWIIIWGRRFSGKWNEEIVIRVSLVGLINLLFIIFIKLLCCKSICSVEFLVIFGIFWFVFLNCNYNCWSNVLEFIC